MIIDEGKLNEFLGRFVGGPRCHRPRRERFAAQPRRRSITSMTCGAEAPWASEGRLVR
jgi:hypothetical protein